MTLLDSLMNKKSMPVTVGPEDHITQTKLRAKALIEELVSPLSKPNQKIIDEVLNIIVQSSSLPDSAVNKEIVMKTTRDLLFELVEPISNPNKQLVDELLTLVTKDSSPVQKTPAQPAVQVQANSAENVAGVSAERVTSNEEARILDGHAGLALRQQEAIARAPFPSQGQYSAPVQSQKEIKKAKETRSVMNLLLEQIKELITITNNLNSKLKSQQVRIDSMEGSLNELKKKTQDFDERMLAFEKNMEKFIGLYEVVTNQYNPFVETSSDILEQSGQQNVQQSKLSQEVKQPAQKIIPEPVQEPIPEPEPVKPTFELNGVELKDLHEFSDALIAMSDDQFTTDILGKKDALFAWLGETLSKSDLVTEITDYTTRSEFVKAIVKAAHLE